MARELTTAAGQIARPQDDGWLRGGDLAVRFAWRGDRFGHELGVLDGDACLPIVRSLEGTPLDDWPASPALQSLDLNSGPAANTLALLVGMAGKSHWSASVEVHGEELRFDIACRRRPHDLGWLGSTYVALGTPQLQDRRTARITVAGGAAKSAQMVITLDEQFPETRWEVAGDRLRVVPAAAATQVAQTVRWGYRVALARW